MRGPITEGPTKSRVRVRGPIPPTKQIGFGAGGPIPLAKSNRAVKSNRKDGNLLTETGCNSNCRAVKGALHFRNVVGVSSIVSMPLGFAGLPNKKVSFIVSSGQWIWTVHLLFLCASFAPWATEYTGPYQDSCSGSVGVMFGNLISKQLRLNQKRRNLSYRRK